MQNTIKNWHQLIKTKDPAGLDLILAEDVVFFSPVLHAPQQGKAITTMYLTAAFHVFINESFRYVREVASDNNVALEFEVEIEGIIVNGIDMFSWNEQGKITDFKVFVRPLKAVNLIHQKMAEMLKAG